MFIRDAAPEMLILNFGRITEDILDEVKNIFLAVPATVQARVLLTGIQHPAAALTFTESPEP